MIYPELEREPLGVEPRGGDFAALVDALWIEDPQTLIERGTAAAARSRPVRVSSGGAVDLTDRRAGGSGVEMPPIAPPSVPESTGPRESRSMGPAVRAVVRTLGDGAVKTARPAATALLDAAVAMAMRIAARVLTIGGVAVLAFAVLFSRSRPETFVIGIGALVAGDFLRRRAQLVAHGSGPAAAQDAPRTAVRQVQ